jgi:diguanylate cyclase (GGDEF)-like protein
MLQSFGRTLTRQRVPAALALALVVLLAILGGAALFQDERAMRSSRQRAEETVEQLGRTAEGVLNRQLLQTDGALSGVPLLLAGQSAPGVPFDAGAASRLLRGMSFQTFTFRDILILQEDGRVLASARGAEGRQIEIAGSDAANPISRPGASRLIGPVRNPLTGEWVSYILRHFKMPGLGDAMLAAEIPIPLLTTSLAPIAERRGFSIRLQLADGRVLATYPHDEEAIGRTAGADPFVPAEGRRAAIETERPTLYPELRLVLGYDADVAMEEWARDSRLLYLLVSAAAALITAVFVGLLIGLRRQARLEAERQAAQLRLEDALDAMSDGFVMWDAADRLVTCNRQYLELYEKSAPYLVPGVDFQTVMRKGAENGQYPQAGSDIEGFLEEMLRWRRGGAGSLERLLPDGRWLLITERPTRSGGSVGIRTDITALKKTMTELGAAKDQLQTMMSTVERQNAWFDAALNNMSQGLLMGGNDGRIAICNGRFLALFGLPADAAVVGLDLGELFALIEAQGFQAADLLQSILHRQLSLNVSRCSNAFVEMSAGGRAIAVAHRPLPDGGFVATYEDVTERQQIEQRIQHQALHDALTGLPNRIYFRQELTAALDAADSADGGVMLLYLDLDRFKEVNDSLGHPVGDALLIAVAERLRACLPSGHLVARLGGDEFAIVLRGRSAEAQAEILGRRIIEALEQDFSIDGHRVSIGVSIGAAAAKPSAAAADTLLKHADLALYEAKAQGRGRYCLFEPQLAEHLRHRLGLEIDLRRAVEDKAFDVAYQPLFDLRTNAVVGFEALLRWNHPERGFVSPPDFLPLAEDLGLIDSIGLFVLNRACADAVRMAGAPSVAVNVSPNQLKAEDFAEQVMEALRVSALRPDRLELEITETALLMDDERIIAQLWKLRDLGVRIALDDFGVGYSSLNYIRRVPLDKIKIDQVFVREATQRGDCAAIIRAIVGLARQLKIKTTAEGIENQDQLDLVRKLGCDQGQGYLLGKPMPIANAVALTGKSRKAPSQPLSAAA